MPKSVLILLLGLLMLQFACGGGSSSPPPPPPPPNITISISPTTPSVIVGATQQFTATVTGSTNTAVTWSVTGSGTISSSGLYTAPVSLTTPGSATVKATPQADTSKSASATITIPAVSATVSPSTPSVILGGTQQFSATVSNATDTSVTWSVAGGGAITSGGFYAAPDSLATPNSATITATPNADPSKAASTALTIPAVSVALSPGTATLNAGTSLKFNATVTNATNIEVTWTLTGNGTLDNTGLYHSPSSIANPDSATVTATSKADPGKMASVTVSLQPISLGVSGYVIMPDGGWKTLTVSAIDSATGKLRPAGLTFVSVDTYTNPMLVAVHPSGRFVYTDAGFVGFYGYSLDADGSLTPIPGSPFAAPNCRPSVMTIPPNGKFLYVGNDYGYMWGFSIDQNSGALTALSGLPWNLGFSGRALTADPASKYLYVGSDAGYNDANIAVYSIDSTSGALTAVQTIVAPGTGRPTGMGIVPSGKFLYITGFDGAVVDGFTIDAATGKLTFIPGSPFPGGGGVGEGLAIDPLGKYVYAGNRGGVAMYTIDNTTGVLTEVTGSPFLLGFTESSDFHPDPTGNFLYTNDDFTMTALKVDRVNNQLTFLNSVHSRTTGGTGRWYRFGLAPATSDVSATPKFTYVLNNQDKTITTYSIDNTGGDLTQVGSAVSTGGTNPQAMATDWYGNFLYVVNQDSNTVSAFTINRMTGALTAVAGSPFTTGPAPTGVAVEGTGRVLYVGTSGDDSFYVYFIDSVTGALTFAHSMPTGQCVGTRTLVADWRGTLLYQVCPGSNTIAVYSLTPEIGGLASTSPSQVVNVGGTSFALSPYGVTPPVSPSKPYWVYFAFLVSQSDQQIKQFYVGNVGQLGLASSGPLGPNQGLAVDPRGRFVYGANASANNVQADAINPIDGTLTEAVGSPWGTGTFPVAAAVDSTGRFLYVVNRDSNTVSGFTINQTSGALTPLSSATFSTGNKPVAILTTGTIE